MKYIVASILLSFYSITSTGQILRPVSWSFEVTQNQDQTYTFKATAKMKDEWVIYSQHIKEGGPIPLSFSFENVDLIGETIEESEAIVMMSTLFEMELIKFKKEAVFSQRFNKKEGQKTIAGSLTFMCCDELRCLPPTDVDFVLEI